MPEPTPGAQRISLVDRVAARFGYQRTPNDLTTTQFGPGQPIAPTPISENPAPRQFQYPVGANISLRPRGEYPALVLTPFEQLRQLARFYDVASICIETRINWLTTARWSVVAKDKRLQTELQPLCRRVEAFWRKPDRVNVFPVWLRTLMLDQLEIDALTLYKQRDLAGRLLALKPRDGATFKPLLNELGETAAYQQILYGYVRGEYDRAHVTPPDAWPVGGDLIYAPRWVSTDSPYGRSPTEQIILRVNTAIRKQTMDLAHFTDGNVPAGFMAPPEGVNMQPEQVRQFEDAFNADLAGDDRARNRIKFMPWDGRYQESKPFSYSTEIDQFLLEIACASYHVPKNELGMTDKVNKASSQEQEDVAFRHAIEPDASWLKTVILDPVIHEDLTFISPQVSEIEFAFDFGKAENEAAIASTEQADVKSGIISATESRRRRYPDLDGDAPGAPVPPDAPAMKLYNGFDLVKFDPTMGANAPTVDTSTGLVASDLARPKRKRTRGKRKPIDVAALLESESSGALDWARKASEGDNPPIVAKIAPPAPPAAPITIVMPPEAHDDSAVAQALDTVRSALEALRDKPAPTVPPRVIVKAIERDGDGRMLRVTETEQVDVD